MNSLLRAFAVLLAAFGFCASAPANQDSKTENVDVAQQINELPVETQLTGDHAICN